MVALNVAGIVRWLWRTVVFLNGMNLVFILLHRGLGYEWVFGLSRAFRTHREANIPTWFSGCLLCAGALLLLGIAGEERRNRRPYANHWFALGLIFLALSLDEVIGLHEAWGYVPAYFFPETFLHSVFWVVAYAFPLGVFAVCYWSFWKALDSPARRGLCLAGCLYVGGAFVMEMVEGYFYLQGHAFDLRSDLVTSLEEAMEMSGLVVLIHTLLDRLTRHGASGPPIESSGDRRSAGSDVEEPLKARREPVGLGS